MTTQTEKIIPYSVGLVHASVCADNSLTPEQVEEEMNRIHPSGTESGWGISENKTFADGTPNPCDCDQSPETRKHYLMTC